jgi:hypothetical protein
MDQVFYFDQYIALGAAYLSLNNGKAIAAAGDLGFAFWFGKSAVARVGLKNYLYNEKRLLGSSLRWDAVGAIEVGMLLGGNKK